MNYQDYKEKDEFDPVLDDALMEYRDAEPLAGLESRIARRLQAEDEPSRNRHWLWSAVLACAAILVIAVWFGVRSRSRDIAPSQPSAAQAQPAPKIPDEAKPDEASPIADSRRTPRKNGSSAKLRAAGVDPAVQHNSSAQTKQVSGNVSSGNQFPLPTSLSPDELSLIAAARSHPDILLNSPVTGQELAIAPIHIQPLPDSTGDEQGEDQ